ncbi:DIS3-like exonuclease 2 isoform X3 [Pecten maximus]|uniref:DIS3-like exonuclease 2 isoform X3 n=1 Tax=Pecten maximus TaxID=6579 RepID=UPI001457EA26|nr:DIS3-like exonuclease 2 isoform X3 [Pecten maximus]
MFMTCFVTFRSHLLLRRKWKLAQFVAVQTVKGRGLVFSSHFNKTKSTSKRLLKSQQRMTKTIEILFSKYEYQKKVLSESKVISKRTSSTIQRIAASEEVDSSSNEIEPSSNISEDNRGLPDVNDSLTMEGQERGAKPKKGQGHKQRVSSARKQKGQGQHEGAESARTHQGQGHHESTRTHQGQGHHESTRTHQGQGHHESTRTHQGQGHHESTRTHQGQGHLEGAEFAMTPGKCRAQSNTNRNRNGRRPKSDTKVYNSPHSSSGYQNRRQFTKDVQPGMKHQNMSKEEIEAGIKSGNIIQGELRVKMRDYKTAYVSHPDGGSDVVIEGLEYRKPALTGDVVAVQIFEDLNVQEADKMDKKKGPEKNKKPVQSVEQLESKCAALDLNTDVQASSQVTAPECGSDTPDVIIEEDQTTIVKPEVPKESVAPVSTTNDVPLKKRQRKGKVVTVLERKHLRICAGHIKPLKTNDGVLFSPTDNRLPRILVSLDSCPPDILTRPASYSSMLFAAKIQDWTHDSAFAKGVLIREIGEDKDMEPRIDAILLEHGVDDSEFSPEVLESLPIQTLPWTIPQKQLAKRRDFRTQCVFTIDPATARDLDDALSIEELSDGTFDVGVHIADVTFFLQEDTQLDSVAGKRATSVYLPHKVIPMLPRILCEELCSLNPDEDRLTFSVVWNMSAEGEIYHEWFGRSVIRSCTKLSYDHAQGFIDDPDKAWTTEEFPPISSNFTLEQIKKRVLDLNKIAVNLREKRMDHGALVLNMPRMSFNLDDESGMPNGFYLPQQKGSNRLVEEFMLLANMAVAHKINKCLPETALLRRHPTPDQSSAEEMGKLSQSLGVPLDFTTSLSLQKSLNAIAVENPHDVGKLTILSVMCSKPMQLAVYFCNGCLEDETLFRHFGLNVPLYTHFTSPIRRYADVMVHRALSSALEESQLNNDKTKLDKICGVCNDRKKAAKDVSEDCAEVFFSAFIQETGPMEAVAMVTGVLDHSVDVYFLKLGFSKRVYVENLPLKTATYMNGEKLILVWKQVNGMTREISQTLAIFSKVRCTITKGKLPLSWMATLNRPEDDSVE